ncbi:hypothetical protein [Cohnella hashimotonis]|uniref:Uncharacterized protein n=1 Tax=Cohnella hashimotonis TaxID=2826895 RepID=A0ABT6TC50_9BACL|nr:hypothetical protein [Cohnella hashimotonis]MDI4643883.1 hypothetical protein [Cohnella hashimotonis]
MSFLPLKKSIKMRKTRPIDEPVIARREESVLSILTRAAAIRGQAGALAACGAFRMFRGAKNLHLYMYFLPTNDT